MSDCGLSGAIIAGILGFFVYGTVGGALGSALFAICIGICTVLCVVPIIGVVFFVMMVNWVSPLILSYVGLNHTWLNSLIFGYYLGMGIILNIYATYVLFLRR